MGETSRAVIFSLTREQNRLIRPFGESRLDSLNWIVQMMGCDGWRLIVVCHKACRREYVVLTTSSMKGDKHCQGCGAFIQGQKSFEGHKY